MPFNVSWVARGLAVAVAVAVFNALKLKCSRRVSNASGNKRND
jgi:hypothetical protein